LLFLQPIAWIRSFMQMLFEYSRAHWRRLDTFFGELFLFLVFARCF
jgi:hypothetical protein